MGTAARTVRTWGPRLGAAIALGATLAGHPCFAQTPEELAAARQVFNEGKDLEKRNAWAEALEKFKRVAGVKMTPQVRFHIALCEENLGKLVSAIKGFELAAEDARQVGSTAAEVAEKAPARAEALRKRIGTIKIEVTGKVIQSKLLLDGAKVEAAAFGAEIPVDPGSHVIEVQDPAGKSTFKKELSVGEHGAEKVSVEVNDVEPPPPPFPTVTASPIAPPPPPPSRLPAYIVGGAGAALVVGWGVFFGLERGAIAEARTHCVGGDQRCTEEARPAIERGRTYYVVSNVFLGVGLAGLAGAGVLWFVLGPRKQGPPKAAVTLSPAGPGIQIRAAF